MYTTVKATFKKVRKELAAKSHRTHPRRNSVILTILLVHEIARTPETGSNI